MVTVICSGEEEIWNSREEAAAFYLEGMIASEGSEQSRYTKIYTELMAGLDVCSDED